MKSSAFSIWSWYDFGNGGDALAGTEANEQMNQNKAAFAELGAIVLGMLLLIGLASQSGCRRQEENTEGTAPAISTNEPGPAATEAARSWLATNAIRLDTVEAGHGFADLQPLKAVIGPARIVALGEATHGTREFFQCKHRMLEFLVTEMGFNIFAMEASMPESFDINDLVLTGRGDPAKALAGLYFWTWDTEEVRAMIEWMRRYNADPQHARKVKFYGFDMQSAPRAAKVTLAYLRKVDPAEAQRVEKELALLANPYTDDEFDKLAQKQKTAVNKEIQALLDDDRRGFQPLRDRLLFEVLYSTGCRVSEVCSLDLATVAGKSRFSVTGKGNKKRTVLLSWCSRLSAPARS